MSAAKKLKIVSVADYLAGELDSTVKQEYLGGVVYAMAGTRNLHNIIKGNTYVTLHVRLRGRPCHPFDSDTKIRIQLPHQVRFYYPDLSVVCQSNPVTDSYQDHPAVIAEVLSRRTRRIDEGEKKDAYLTIGSLRAYLLIEQDLPAVRVYRRTEQGFAHELYESLDAVIPLKEIEAELPLAEIYADVRFSAETAEQEEV